MLNDGILYVGTIGGKVIALNAYNGTELDNWEAEVEGQSSGGFGCSNYVSKAMSTYGVPVVKDGVVYVGGYDGTVYAFATVGAMSTTFETGGNIVGSPIIDDETNTLFVGSSDGKLYAREADNIKNEKWTFKTGDKIWSTPAVDNGVVYIGSADHRLYAVDIDTGDELWHFQAEAAILSTPYIHEGTVYIGACDNKFYAINIEQEGKEAITFNQGGNWYWTQALAYDGKIYVGNLDHKIYILDAQDITNKLDEYTTGGRVLTPPVLLNDRIIFGSEDGNVYYYDTNEDTWGELCSLGAPILAPICPDRENGVIYVHAQDGSHVLYAIEVETGEEIWSHNTG